MSALPSTLNTRLAPRLTMDEYADFVETSLLDCDRAYATRQKEMEERIQTSFRMSRDEPVEGKAEPALKSLPGSLLA